MTMTYLSASTPFSVLGDSGMSVEHSVLQLPGGDTLVVSGDEAILEMANGDRLFICNDMAQLDTDLDVELTCSGSIFQYVYPDGDIIVVRDQRLIYLRRACCRIIADSDNAGRFHFFEI
jgi:hypothetical protein